MEQTYFQLKTKGFEPNHLGTILCRYCNTMIDTLPTSGAKRFYGVCEDCCNKKGSTPPRQ